MAEGNTTLKGASPIRKRGANYNSAGFNWYPIANAYGTTMGQGDLVKLVGGVLQLAANGDKVLGVLDEVMYVSSGSGQLINRLGFPAGLSSKSGVKVLGDYSQPMGAVYDDQDQMFAMRVGDAQSPVLANIGKAFPLTGQGTVLNGRSQATVDIGTTGTTGNMAVVIIDAYRTTGNGLGIAGSAVEVKLANPGYVDNVANLTQ